MKIYLKTLWACDMVSKEVWTLKGKVQHFILFFIEIGTALSCTASRVGGRRAASIPPAAAALLLLAGALAVALVPP